jgi:anaerobic selenocysteine-containing dehydrogenase
MSADDETFTHHRTCPLCEATCGLSLTVQRGADGSPGPVTRVRGDRDDVFSQGFLCPKGSTVGRLHDDPDRLRQPLVRRGDDPATATWEAVSWDEAFAEIERRLTPILDEHGRDAVAVYLGNPNVHNLGGTLYGGALLRALGTGNVFSASTLDQMPKHVTSGYLFGNAGTIPVPDLDRTDHLLMLGANPWESNGSLATAPDFPGRVLAIRERGGKVVVVDPRRTRTAANADEHVAVRPGGDAHLLVAMINVLFAEDLVDLGRLAPYVSGVDEVRALVEPFTPEAVAPLAGVDADTIVRLTRELAAAPSAAVYGRMGTHTVAFGTLASWAVDVLNVLTGNLDRPGGAMFPLPAHGQRSPRRPGRGFSVGRRHSRVKGHPEVKGELPVATLADEIETPGAGQVRAMVVVAGNPARSAPDTARLEQAMAGLDLVISVDIYRNETSRLAHVILPPPSLLERSHYDLALYGLAVRNIAHWSPPLYDRGDRPDEADILSRLALIASGAGATADPAVIHDMMLANVLGRAVKPGGPHEGGDVKDLEAMLEATQPVDRLLEAMIRLGAYGDRFGLDPEGLTFARLRDAPHGIDLGPLDHRVPDAITTASGLIELAPAAIAADVPRLAAALGDAPPGLVLVGRRHVRSNNSWMHNVEVLVKGRDRCTLQMHPDDAGPLGLADGDRAEIRSRVGAVVAPVEVTTDIRPGVVSLPHGWGHDAQGADLSVASGRPGVNANLLTDAAEIEPLSGNAVLNGVPVTVSPLAYAGTSAEPSSSAMLA